MLATSSQEFTFLCLLNAAIKNICCHAQLKPIPFLVILFYLFRVFASECRPRCARCQCGCQRTTFRSSCLPPHWAGRLSLAVSAAYSILQSSWSMSFQTIAVFLSLPTLTPSCHNSARITDMHGCVSLTVFVFCFFNTGSEDWTPVSKILRLLPLFAEPSSQP